MAAVHLIVGYMGFGKTVFARRLERELPAVRFTHDGFMHALYGRNLPEEEFRDAWQRVDALIWKLAEQTVKAGAHAILDYGFWSREARRRAYERARKLTRRRRFPSAALRQGNSAGPGACAQCRRR